MQSVMVTIGRNVGNVPMSDETWDSFQNDVSAALYANVANDDSWLETSTGWGEWDGVRETNARLALLAADTSHVDTLRATLATLAAKYGQDAVALAIGESELVGAS